MVMYGFGANDCVTMKRKNNNSGGKQAAKKQKVSSVEVRSVPAARGGTFATRFEVSSGGRFRDSIRVRGTEYLAGLSSTASPAAGQCLLNMPVSPADWAGTRIELFSRMYEKYLFRKLDFEYIPTAASTTTGSVVIAYDRDPSDDTPPPGLAGIHTYTSWQDAVVTDVKVGRTAHCPLNQPDTGYYVNDVPGGDERLSDQGQIYVAQVEPSQPSSQLGSLLVHYDLELFVPQMETQPPLNFSGKQPVSKTPLGTDNRSVLGLLVDALAPSIAAAAQRSYQPIVNAAGKAVVRLSEGVYRATLTGTDHGTGASVSFQNPVITALEPKIAPAPQPAYQLVRDSESSAPGDTLSIQALLNIPSGGADVQWDMASSLPADTAANVWPLSFDISKVSKGYFTGNLADYVI